MKLPSAILLLLVVALAGCTDWGLGLDGRNLQGTYALDGTVYGQPAHSVTGMLHIDERRRGGSEAWLDWNYREGAYTVVEIDTQSPARVEGSGYDRVRFDFEGDLWTGSRYVWFRLEHEGQVSGRVIRGTWRLRTGLGTSERGDFVARR